MEKRGAFRNPALFLGYQGQKRDQILETPYSDFRFRAIKASGGCFMKVQKHYFWHSHTLHLALWVATWRGAWLVLPGCVQPRPADACWLA